MLRQITYMLLIFAMVGIGISTQAELLFVDNFDQGLDNWEHIGNGEISIVDDNTAPSFGPKILNLENSDASNCIAYLKDFEFTDGVLTYLLKDVDLGEGADFDCDGPGFARVTQAKEEMPIAEAFPTGYTIELDLDGGFHILWGANGDGDNIVVDDSIKTTGKWTWIKFSLMGNELKGKSWLADEDEPENWQLIGQDDRYSEGAVAMRVWSGTMHVAHIRITEHDEPYLVQAGGKLAITWGTLKF